MNMASQKVGLVPPHRLDNGINSQLVFLEDSVPFSRPNVSLAAPQHQAGDPGPRTRELSGFMDEKLFAVDRDRYFAAAQGPDFRRSILVGTATDRREHPEIQNRRESTPAYSGDGSHEDDDDGDDGEDDEDDDDDEGDGEVEAFVGQNNSNHDKNGNSNSSDSIHSCAAEKKITGANAKHRSSFGSDGGMLPKDNNFVRCGNDNARVRLGENCQQPRVVSNYQNAITIAEPGGEMYYTEFLHGPEGSAPRQKEFVVDNGCSFSGRKDVADSSESGESLRAILSDPMTGSLMDDAMILPCGHSFGSNGIQQVLRVKACFTCSQPVAEDLVAPNLSLRAAVQAFRREEESQLYRASRKRRERFEQDRGNCDSYMDPPRGRGVQFPFAVTDRVIIKGNKRTPERFVGREAVVTTQCLNGWYVVKTLDNAESVKLQYRSLAKVPDISGSKPTPSKTSNWL